MELCTVNIKLSANVDTAVDTTDVDSVVGNVKDGAGGTNESNGEDVDLQKDGNLSAVNG